MNRHLYIYLAGTIKKGKEEENELEWTKQEMNLLQECLSPHPVTFLNPSIRSDDLSDQKSVLGRDLFQIYSSDLILVDARAKRGLGVGSEMMFAKMNRIPVVVWLPEESYYHRQKIQFLGQTVKSWIHPFVCHLSDHLAPSLELASLWIQESLLKEKVEIKGPESIQEAMLHYLDTQLYRDNGMHEMVSKDTHLISKMNQLYQNEMIPNSCR